MRKFLLVLCTVLALVGATAQPAQAAPQAGCLVGYACMFDGTSYTGYSVFYNTRADTWLGCNTFNGNPFNNKLSSVYGNYVGENTWIGYYNSHNCTGTPVLGTTGGAYPNLGSGSNVVSSWKMQRVQ